MQFLQEFSIKQGVIFTRTGLILGILGKQGPLRARIGEVVWCFEKGFWGGRIRRGRGENFVLKGSCEFLFQDPPEIFPAKSAQKFSIKV
jgi:hypothetical protein